MGDGAFAREKEMRPVVSAWLESWGYDVLYERLIGGYGYCDILAAKPRWNGIDRRRQRKRGWRPLASHIIAVELKLDRVLEAMRQAKGYARGADASYIALPAENVPRLERHAQWPEYREHGIGVLAVTRDCCTMIVMAKPPRERPERELERQAEKFWREIWKREETPDEG